MTFCLGIRVEQGLIGLADTRVTSGTEVITARKVQVYQHDRHAMFLMTSGLRSVRDKAVTYFEEIIEQTEENFDRLYLAVNAFGEAIRRVAREDKASLVEAGLSFDISCLVGGQLKNDTQPHLFLLYAQGNWVEVGQGTPFQIIGESGYGKPILVRTMHYHDSIRHALQVATLAFDSTRISAADVDFPIDVVIYEKDSFRVMQARLEYDDLRQITDTWHSQLRRSLEGLSDDWINVAFPGAPEFQPADLPRPDATTSSST